MVKVIGGVILIILGIILLLAIIYVASGIQARAWMDVFNDKFNNFKNDGKKE
mgnify:CR=1 FL=1